MAIVLHQRLPVFRCVLYMCSELLSLCTPWFALCPTAPDSSLFVAFVMCCLARRSPVALRNVLIDSDGKMMICDFGLSKVMHTGKDGNVYASNDQGAAVPEHGGRLAPETHETDRYTEKTDVRVHVMYPCNDAF